MTKEEKYIARPNQLLKDHLIGAAAKARLFASKIGLENCGELLGLLHDIGKYSQDFQNYINSISGTLDPDLDDDYMDPKQHKGKIDHSTAGAQWIWRMKKKDSTKGELLIRQIMALCVASHHSGLIDCLKPDGCPGFNNRIEKNDEKSHYDECLQNIDPDILERMTHISDNILFPEMVQKIKTFTATDQTKWFYFGLLTKFLFSCLIDADRIDSANPDKPYQPRQTDWQIAIDQVESKLKHFSSTSAIDSIRKKISDNCYEKAFKEQGIYTLTVPTGGGKTLASLRYALHHAKKHQLDRIVYIIPYTSIIEQNAKVIREFVENEGNEWVLEHHSNLEPEKETWHSKLSAENWSSPIILTTMVQFLEVLFSGGTQSVRRLHQLAKSVLIFDEIQTLPIKCTYLFCNAINFLVEHAQVTALLCTATQPLLNALKHPKSEDYFFPKGEELIDDVGQVFNDLKRVQIINGCKNGGWDVDEIVSLALKELSDKGSCLIIVNTKSWAKNLFQLCKEKGSITGLYHLSTHQYPAHRQKLLEEIRKRLNDKLPVLCISTQLMEAGVDIDFATVIRFLAGLDSIAQAAGRCNRHAMLSDASGNPMPGKVYILNPDKEHIDELTDIQIGKEKTQRVLSELKDPDHLLLPKSIELYFKYYFYQRSSEMSFNVPAKEFGYDTNLFNLLSNDVKNGGYNSKSYLLQHSFMTAGKLFSVIDAPTKAIIIQHGKGQDLITQLCSVAKEFDKKRYYDLLRLAQRYSVNVFPNTWRALCEKGAILEIQGEGVFYLNECYYSEEFGVSADPVTEMSSMVV